MNCLELRRDILANPASASEEGLRHADSCPSCAVFRARALALETEIADLLAVPAPDGMEDRILAATVAGRRDSRRRFLAMAASIAGVAFVGAGAYFATQDDPDALAGINFVVEEEANAILTAKPANPADLVRVTHLMNLTLPSQLGEVRYIGTCPFQGTIAHHLIVTTPQGKATLLLLPDKSVDQRGVASARGLRSLVKPARRGSAAVIAESSRGLERIEQMVWSS